MTLNQNDFENSYVEGFHSILGLTGDTNINLTSLSYCSEKKGLTRYDRCRSV